MIQKQSSRTDNAGALGWVSALLRKRRFTAYRRTLEVSKSIKEATDAIAGLKDNAASVTGLVDTLHDVVTTTPPHTECWKQAIKALCGIERERAGQADVLPHLMKGLNSTDYEAFWVTCDLIQKAGDKRAVDKLLELQSGGEAGNRVNAALTLAALGDDRCSDVLLFYMKRHAVAPTGEKWRTCRVAQALAQLKGSAWVECRCRKDAANVLSGLCACDSCSCDVRRGNGVLNKRNTALYCARCWHTMKGRDGRGEEIPIDESWEEGVSYTNECWK